MKRMDIFCSSPASTAICSSINHRSMVRRSHKPIFEPHHQTRKALGDHHRAPCSSHLPINPRPFFEASRKSTSSSYNSNTVKRGNEEVRRKSSADILDLKSSRRDSSSCYLLGESPATFMLDWLPENTTTRGDRVQRRLVAFEPEKLKFRSLSVNDSSSLVKSSSTNRSRHQVVVLRVSLHCKGCEGKVRKHLAKMEGVTSFSVDFMAKKVTVVGDVTPLGVLASVSKVKNAQLWPSPTSSSSSSSPLSA